MFKRKRLETDWNWSHALRNSLWETLASKYPREFLPLGTVSAEVGSTTSHIGPDLPHSTTIYTFISFLYTLVLSSEFLLFLPMILFILMLEKKMIASMGNGCGSCVEGKMAQDQLFM